MFQWQFGWLRYFGISFVSAKHWGLRVSEEWLRSTMSALAAPDVSKLLRKEQLS